MLEGATIYCLSGSGAVRFRHRAEALNLVLDANAGAAHARASPDKDHISLFFGPR